MLCQAVLTLLVLVGYAVAQTCSSSSPCKIGCCNKWGNCGFGPDFCGSNCISDCDRKSECNPGFGAEWATRDKCPLNVCCSKHGFCGTTAEFCGDKKVKHKTCSKDNGNARVIGYYEGWVTKRPCNVFWPEQIPIGLYTHINFAFATVNPTTFKIEPAAQADINLYNRLMLLKKKDPNLKIFVALGGWAFNDPGATATTFSDLAASLPRQKVFIESLTSFMSTYGFDGIDMDWEYPAAPDRSGREVDFDNFPKFMDRLKMSLKSGHKGLTITIPAAYWYLQYFDLKNLAKSVDWFNVMSYDLHGLWDRGNRWTGNFLNAHTNLTEIDLALDLLWRNDINPSQVVMGLGFYGRSFSATSSNCLAPGCTFESAGEKGKCSRENGILLNSEIDQLVEQHGVHPVLFEKEAVKVASWGNQWVAYDDEETLQLKSEYAQTLCLGGLMVWAISHDTKSAKYNKALAKVANRKLKALPVTDSTDNPYDFIDVANPQCKWTNCGESCPSGWILMSREDSGSRGKEYMFDETGCDGAVHSFCCPPSSKLPTCGWYTHNNGACDNTCPEGTVEVGSNDKYCRESYQAACCTTDTKSMQLYAKCKWGPYPMCDSQRGCSGVGGSMSSLLAASSSGSGAGTCNIQGYVGNSLEYQKRKFCCDTSKKKEAFSDCQWYTGTTDLILGDIGLGISGRGSCQSACPADRVRVAMDGGETEAECDTGKRARCCLPSFFDTIEVENPKLENYRDSLKAFIADPKCDNPGQIFETRSLDIFDQSNSWWTRVQPRAENTRIKEAEGVLLALVTKTGTAALREAIEKIWNDIVADKFSHMKFPAFRDFVTKLPEYGISGPIQLCHNIICNPNYWNARSGGNGGARVVNCTEGLCTTEDCGLETSKRHIEASSSNAAWLAANELALRGPRLQKRIGGARSYRTTARSPDGSDQVTLSVTLPSYQTISDLDMDDPLQDEAIDFINRGDCTQSGVAHFAIPNGETFEMEHLLDGNVIARFIEDAAAGRLRSGAIARSGPVAVSFFRQARTMPLLPNPPPLPGGADYIRLYDRVMECLGSRTNTANFVIAHQDINKAKTPMMQGKNATDFGKLEDFAKDIPYPERALLHLRASTGVINYLNYRGTPNANQRLTNIINDVSEQWRHGERTWNANNPNNPVNIAAFWHEWTVDFFLWLTARTRRFNEDGISLMRQYWAVTTVETGPQVLEILNSMEAGLSRLAIDTTGFKKY